MDSIRAHATKAEVAYANIRDAIRQGTLKPGQRVTLTDLSERLNMSLTPVREALQQLEAHGLIVHESNRGTFIAEFTEEKARQIYRLRKLLEPFATQLATQLANDDQLRALRERLDQLNENAAPMQLAQLNFELHRAIYALCGDRMLIDFIAQLWSGVPFQTITLSGEAARAAQARAEHEAILQAMAQRQPEAAAGMMRDHIASGERAALRSLCARHKSQV